MSGQETIETQPSSSRWRRKPSLGMVGIFLTLVFGVPALAFGIIAWLDEDATKLELNFLATDLITTPEVPDLAANYSFQGQSIDNLWQILIQIKNTGDQSIIGRGPQSDLIDQSLSVFIDPPYQVLRSELRASDLDVQLISAPDKLIFGFDQWRPGEEILVSMMASNLGSDADSSVLNPEITISGRPLIDGDINILEVTSLFGQENEKSDSSANSIPLWVSWLLMIYGAVVISITTISFYRIRRLHRV